MLSTTLYASWGNADITGAILHFGEALTRLVSFFTFNNYNATLLLENIEQTRLPVFMQSV